MHHYPMSIQTLVKHFAKLPGIGEKTAERLAMHILRATRQDAEQLAQSILEVKEKVRLCANCFVLSDRDLCQICSDPARDPALVCVVEQPADLAAIEKSGSYQGVYHVLQGVLCPMDGVGPDDIRIRELVEKAGTGKLREIILATGTSVEGESTAAYIARRLGSLSVKVTRIASGVPMGGDLKYVDQVTLKRAMETRHAI